MSLTKRVVLGTLGAVGAYVALSDLVGTVRRRLKVRALMHGLESEDLSVRLDAAEELVALLAGPTGTEEERESWVERVLDYGWMEFLVNRLNAARNDGSSSVFLATLMELLVPIASNPTGRAFLQAKNVSIILVECIREVSRGDLVHQKAMKLFLELIRFDILRASTGGYPELLEDLPMEGTVPDIELAQKLTKVPIESLIECRNARSNEAYEYIVRAMTRESASEGTVEAACECLSVLSQDHESVKRLLALRIKAILQKFVKERGYVFPAIVRLVRNITLHDPQMMSSIVHQISAILVRGEREPAHLIFDVLICLFEFGSNARTDSDKLLMVQTIRQNGSLRGVVHLQLAPVATLQKLSEQILHICLQIEPSSKEDIGQYFEEIRPQLARLEEQRRMMQMQQMQLQQMMAAQGIEFQME